MAQEEQIATQSWDFQTVSPRKSFVWEPDRRVLVCVAILWLGKFSLPCEFSPHYHGKGKCLTTSYRPAGTTSTGRLFGLALASPRYPSPLGSVPWGQGSVVQSWDFQSVRPKGAIVLDQNKVIKPLLWAGPASSTQETLFIYPLEPGVAELAPAEGKAGCSQPEPAVESL